MRLDVTSLNWQNVAQPREFQWASETCPSAGATGVPMEMVQTLLPLYRIFNFIFSLQLSLSVTCFRFYVTPSCDEDHLSPFARVTQEPLSYHIVSTTMKLAESAIPSCVVSSTRQ